MPEPQNLSGAKPHILIGTSGYDYPEWKGVFYPENLKRADFLAYYATQFNALELNNTFYNMPDKTRIMSFYERSEGRLSFSVKVNRLLTHEIGPAWNTVARDFRSAVTPLLEKDVLSALLFQLPESFHYTAENRVYLSELLAAFDGFQSVVEFRHKEWIRESVFEGLEKRHSGIVFCDMPQLKNLPDGSVLKTPFIGPNAYIRLHGRNADAWYVHDAAQNGSARYDYDYSDEELAQFIAVIRTAGEEGKTVQVYFNNHPKGKGARNGITLRDMIAQQNAV